MCWMLLDPRGGRKVAPLLLRRGFVSTLRLTTSHRNGFSLIEAMVALSITAIAGSVLLLATESVLQTTNDAVAQTVAQGMAAQLIDEVLGARFAGGTDPYETTLAPSAWEKAGAGRERYNDTDDYDGYTAAPPKDAWGMALGQGDTNGALRHPSLRNSSTEFQDWKQKIEVYYVSATDHTVRLADNQPTDYRAVEVTIERTEPNGSVRPLAKMRRVFCYVPIP
jgi:prepilin-type N-terminal cleavage/methylation domain-containing protein